MSRPYKNDKGEYIYPSDKPDAHGIRNEFPSGNQANRAFKAHMVSLGVHPVTRARAYELGVPWDYSEFVANYKGSTPKPKISLEELYEAYHISSESDDNISVEKLDSGDPLDRFKTAPTQEAEFPSLTREELATEAYLRGGVCKGCGLPLGGFKQRGSSNKLQRVQTVQMHIPSKAWARFYGQTLTKGNIFAGHKDCNGMHSSKLIDPEVMIEVTLEALGHRHITYYPKEEVGSRQIPSTRTEHFLLEERN